eukprot:jgi/Ulvmu1/6161/UM028_0017.1
MSNWYAGGFGGFNWRDWWTGFSEWMDPYLRFLTAFFVLSFFPVVVDLATGGWKVIPQILRLDSSSRSTERLQRSRVDDPDGKLGQEERDIMEKYGSGTDDLQ